METTEKKTAYWRFLPWIAGVYLLYSLVSVLSKLAAGQPFLSLSFLLLVAAAFVCLGVYAVIWQQLIQRTDLSTAYACKGLTVIYGLVWGVLLFRETVSIYNIVGALIILVGVYVVGRYGGD